MIPSFQKAWALHQQGQLQQAQDAYHQILAQDSDHFDALHMLGVLTYQLGQMKQALTWVERALSVNPHHAMAHSNHGNILRALGHTQAAIASYDQALALKPNLAGIHQNRGNALLDLKRYEDALQSYDQALVLGASNANLYNHRGVALRALKQYSAALDSYDHALVLASHDAALHNNRGNLLRDLKQPQAALESYDVALSLQTDDPSTHFNRGGALEDLKQYAAALDSYNLSLTSAPDHAAAHSSRADVLHQLGQHQAALDSYARAIELDPKYAQAYSNRGVVLRSLQQHEQALESYTQALLLKPDDATTHWNQSLCYLQLGDFERGWPAYEWRWKTAHFASDLRDNPQPRWSGQESLQGQTLLLFSEQGLGDTLQFCRYALLVQALGAKVILEVQAPLVSLLRSLTGVTQVIARGNPLPAFDLQCPLLSLPWACKTQPNNIPAPGRYLGSSPDCVERWKRILGKHQRPWIGLVASGSAQHSNDRQRSVAWADWLPYLPTGPTYLSLQKPLREGDHTLLQKRTDLIHVGDSLQDFSDTAAVCDLLDLVISVDTSVAHLAGALDKPVWTLLPFGADWRWLKGQTTSPWYPSMQLYQQPSPGNWQVVFARVAKDLQGYLDSTILKSIAK